MSESHQRERRHRLALQRSAECARLLESPAPGTPESQQQADEAAQQLGHRHWFAPLDLLPDRADD